MSDLTAQVQEYLEMINRLDQIETEFHEKHPDFDSTIWDLVNTLIDANYQEATWEILEIREDGGICLQVGISDNYDPVEVSYRHPVIKDGVLIND